MAVDAPLLTRQRVFAAKVETTTGTAETLAADDGKFNIFEPEIKPDIEMNEREGQSALSPLPGVHGLRSGTYTFKTELTGEGGSTPTDSQAQVLWPACGMAYAAGAVTPQTGSSSYTSLTMGHFADGRFYSVAGAVGKVTIKGEAGKPVMCEWEFKGVWQTPGSQAILAPTYPTLIPPRFASATLTIGGTTYKISELEIEIDNTLTQREDVTKASGLHSFVVTNRKVTVKFDPEALGHATKNWHTDWLAHTTAAFQAVIGSDSGNTVTIDIPALQLTTVDLGDRDGVLVDQIEAVAVRDAAAGDDEIEITFS